MLGRKKPEKTTEQAYLELLLILDQFLTDTNDVGKDLQKLRALIEEHETGAGVLEVGKGIGELGDMMRQRVAKVRLRYPELNK